MPKIEQEVMETKIESLEIDKDGKITVKLNREVENVRFLLNGVVVTAKLGSDNTYTIEDPADLLNENEENTLTVTDKNGTFEQSENFVYRKLMAPKGVAVKAESGNASNQVNSSNVKNVGFIVKFNGTNTNPEGTTIVVSVKDSKGNNLELTSPITPGAH